MVGEDAGGLQGVQYGDQSCAEHGSDVDGAASAEEAVQQGQDDKRHRQRVEQEQDRQGGVEHDLQAEVGEGHAGQGVHPHPLAVGDARELLGEVVGDRGDAGDVGGQAGQEDHGADHRQARGAEQHTGGFGEDRAAVVGASDLVDAGRTEPRGGDVQQGQAHHGDQSGLEEDRGGALAGVHALAADGLDEHSAEDQGGEHVHGQVALGEAHEEAVALVVGGDRVVHLAHRGDQGAHDDDHQQDGEHRGEHLADAVDELAGGDRKVDRDTGEHHGEGEQDPGGVRQGVWEVRLHGDLVDHGGGARDDVQRPEGEEEQEAEDDGEASADPLGEAEGVALHRDQGDDCQQHQADAGDEEAGHRLPQGVAGLLADDRGEDDVAGAEEHGEQQQAQGDDPGGGQFLIGWC